MTDRRLSYLEYKLSNLEKHKGVLEDEVKALEERMFTFQKNDQNLWHDRLWSAMLHRKSRLPVLIEHVEQQINVRRDDIVKHKTFH